MRTLLRGKRTGLIAFAVISALVVGGLGWATQAALGLEQEQAATRARADHAEKLRLWQREGEHQTEIRRRERDQRQAETLAEFHAKLRLALWRLDSRIAPVLAREDTRPYSHYSALFAPSIVIDDKGAAYDEAQVFEPSPLLNAELPDWMLLHFQTTVEAGWGSPQVPPEDQVRQLLQNKIQFNNVNRERRKLLKDVAWTASTAVLMARLQKEQQRQTVSQTVPGVLQQVPGDPANVRKQGDNPYGNPNSQKNAEQETRQFLLVVENSKVFLQNSAKQGQWLGGPSKVKEELSTSQQSVIIRLSPMTPVWLPAGDRGDWLVVARRVEILGRVPEWAAVQSAWPAAGLPMNLAVTTLCQYRKVPYPREVCQGILLDWPKLQELLAEEIGDLFPQARFLPVREESPPHPERTMTALPLEVDPGPPPAVAAPPEPRPSPEPGPEPATVEGWTPLRVGLALAWAAALVALGGVGLGGFSLIDLSERRIRFVSAVTHELRTPLTTLRLYLDLLTSGLVVDDKQREEYLHTLHQETERLNRLVGHVLDFSRLENQRPRLELAPAAVAELLESVRAGWEIHCHDCGKQLIVENCLPEDATLTTDLHLVQQILGNLIDNACKYSRAAEDTRLWLRALAEGGRVVLEVEDRGPGVPAAERHSIFRPFCRGRGADVTAGGVGLGLALALRWAELLGGTLTLQEGSGARFRLELSFQK
jgi:signal transduction histidine kinase